MARKKKNAIMLADTRPALVGTTLLQLHSTNPGLFEEAIIYYVDEISMSERELMNSIIPCRFIKYTPPLPDELFVKQRFSLFSSLMFVRYEMFTYLDEFETITWLDTDILVQSDISGMLKAAKKTGAAFIREDPENKTAEKPDRMHTCFASSLPEYYTDDYLYCSGTIVLTDKLPARNRYSEWCYKKTIEWADILSLPDQGVLNALIQEFDIKVTPIPGRIYCCYPYMGRDCSDATIIHTWGMNKFWNDWYLYLKYSGWRVCYEKWLSMGGSGLPYEIKPQISVVIPSYKPNIGLFRQCMDSLMAQRRNSWERFSDFEIIIVAEPFNEDSLRKFVDSYNDPRIRLEFNEARLGIAASLNRGLSLAQGKYIARIDDDDLAAEKRLYLQMEYLNNHEDITLCTSDFEYFGDMNERRVSFEGELAKSWSIFTCPFDHPTIMFRRDFFVENGLYYDEQRGYVEDWELWIRAFDAGMKVGSIHEVLFYHRWINNSSAGQSNKTVEMMRELIQRNFRKLSVEIPIEDLPLMGPWNGRLTSEADVAKLDGYLSDALKNNRVEKVYNQECLEKVFALRMEEARTGILPGLSERINNWSPKQEQGWRSEDTMDTNMLPSGFNNRKTKEPSFIRRFLKKLFKKLYSPFRHRYEDRIIDIQRSGWAIEGHVLNNIAKLDRINATQEEQHNKLMLRIDALETTLKKIDENIILSKQDMKQIDENISGKLDNISESISGKLNNTSECISNKLTNIGDRLYDLSREFRYEQVFWKGERFTERKAILIGTPEHSNIGDAAISLGEIEFIRQYFPEHRLMELSTYDFNDWYGKLSSVVNSEDILFLQGGGNMGSKYLSEENVRRRVISDFPMNKIVILPQTICFDDNAEGLHELTISKEIYNRHNDITLFIRGTQSLMFARQHFSAAKSINAQDMALMLDVNFHLNRKGLLLCIRELNDESGLTKEQYDYVKDTVAKVDSEYVQTNNLNRGEADANIYKDMRRTVVTEELKKFAGCKAVVTDRLHGLIFAIITHTPCVVISSYNQKIAEFCEFFVDSNAIFFIDRDLLVLESTIEKALLVNEPVYPLLNKDVFGDIYRKIVE